MSASARRTAFVQFAERHGYSSAEEPNADGDLDPHVEAFHGGFDAAAALSHDALAEALMKLRAFGYEADALEVEDRYGLRYVEPKPVVLFAEAVS